MFLSKRCLHGLRAVLYLALHDSDRAFTPIQEISDRLNIPFHFLTKILHDLGKADILISSRGAAGGVALQRPASELNALLVIDALEGPHFLRSCVLGFDACSSLAPCALHSQWEAARACILNMFSGESLADIAGRIETEEAFLQALRVERKD
ncbi:MAG: Rrf2 family transcriptional regulator [Verrucomicrobia bacterium]|nr:Rrf2 family transcriptional regulator [Verrucomicrobiota bacterium]MCH8528122.1 Rrf2 family transcriptional regulator [Kiritimatiellia bacterium]